MDVKGEARDTDVLFPGKEIEGYIVKPWTLKQVRLLSPVFVDLFAIAKKEGATPENFMQIIEELLPALLPNAHKIISVSLGVSEDEADELSFGKASILTISILAENVEYLKNFFGLNEKVVGIK